MAGIVMKGSGWRREREMEGRGRKSCPSQILQAFTVTEYCISPHVHYGAEA